MSAIARWVARWTHDDLQVNHSFVSCRLSYETSGSERARARVPRHQHAHQNQAIEETTAWIATATEKDCISYTNMCDAPCAVCVQNTIYTSVHDVAYTKIVYAKQ